MNKKQRKKLSKKTQRLISRAHILIAVVAIIECLVLITFTTYSWIESASSLVIMNGPQSTTTTNNVNIDISNALNYEVNLDSSAGNAELINFFSQTKYYRLGKASSPNGSTFYFPKRNNTYSGATTFRLGDTTDYNTSYNYFDFKIKNEVGNKDFYFNDDTEEKRDIFTVSDPSGYFNEKTYSISEGGTSQTYNKIEAIRRAMRISIVDTIENGETNSCIYSPTGKSYNAQNGLSDSDTKNTTPKKIADYGLNHNSSLSAQNKNILFTSKKNKSSRIQVRIWFEIMDPDFQKAFGFGQNSSNFDSDDFNAIAGVQININLSLGNADNNFRPFYFDDYTFSTTAGNVGGNITLDNASNENYVVWFHCYVKDSNSYVDYPMTREMTSGGRTRWSAEGISQTITDYLCSTDTSGSTGMTSTQLEGCYFAYGPSVGTVTYSWYLNQKPNDGTSEFIYNAYSRYKVGSTYYGSGCWNDRSAVQLVQFKDYSTILVADDFNRSASNFRIINQNPVDHLFVNNMATYNASGTAHYNTAAMFYDSTNDIFKSYVPQSWLNSNIFFRFNLDNNGYNGIDLGFSAGVPVVSNGTDYVYTALGHDENYTLAYYNEHNAASGNNNYIAPGFGTWGGVEQIFLNVELIDYDVKATDRYKVSIAGTDIDSTAKESIPMIPDATGMVYSCYIPANSGVNTSPYLKFVRLNNVNNNNAVNARWYTAARYTSNTYYPVKVDSTADSSDTTRGHWTLSVLVDGTYENLIYDTLTDGDGEGKLEYSFDGLTYNTLMEDSSTAGSPTTDSNRISAYRWYVPCSAGATVYYRWTPYYGTDGNFGTNDDTTFVFIHNTTSGMYCVITEPESAVSIAQNTPSEQRRSLRLGLRSFEANAEQSLSEQSDAAEPETLPLSVDEQLYPDLMADESDDTSAELYDDSTDQYDDYVYDEE